MGFTHFLKHYPSKKTISNDGFAKNSLTACFTLISITLYFIFYNSHSLKFNEYF